MQLLHWLLNAGFEAHYRYKFSGDHESHRCVFSCQKSLNRNAKILVSYQVVAFTGAAGQNKLSSLQNHGALHKDSRMHMELGSGVAFPTMSITACYERSMAQFSALKYWVVATQLLVRLAGALLRGLSFISLYVFRKLSESNLNGNVGNSYEFLAVPWILT